MRKLLALGVLLGLGAAVVYLPWWASLLLVTTVALAAVATGGFLAKRFMHGLFEEKSRTLLDARVRVHAVQSAEPPKPAEDFDDAELAAALEAESPPRQWLSVDCTIEVAASEGGMTYWDPWELVLVAPDTPPGMPDEEAEDEIGEVHGVEQRDAEGRWVAVEDKLSGSQRLRLHVGIAERGLPFRFRYYFEVLPQSEEPAP